MIMNNNSSGQTMKATKFAVYLIEEAMRLNRERLTPTDLEEWLLYKWYDWAKLVSYPKPWPFTLKPLLFSLYNSSDGSNINENPDTK